MKYNTVIPKAVFTPGRNMISRITNKTCFFMKSVDIRQYIARIMVDTWLFWAWLKQSREVVSIRISPNTFKMAHGYGEEAIAQNWRPDSVHVCSELVEGSGYKSRQIPKDRPNVSHFTLKGPITDSPPNWHYRQFPM